MAENFYEFDEEPSGGGGREHLFLWTIFILLLIGAAFACWLGSFYIFGHPEKPRPYKILRKLNKIEPPKRFEVINAPPGEFLAPKKLFERYANKKSLELAAENGDLLRNYIKNYKETNRLVPYITGRFEIMDSRELGPGDMFPSGVVTVAVSEDMPQVLLEHVFTTAPANVAALKENLPPGLDMRLEKTRDLAAIIHVERTADGHLQFTALPLAYGNWAVKGSVGVFSLEPPPALNLDAGLPVVRGSGLQTWLNQFAERLQQRPRPAGEEADKSAPGSPELVRLDTFKPGEPVPETGAMPQMPVATPIPVASIPRAHITPAPITLAANTTPPPRALPLPPRELPAVPVATPIPIATPLPMATPLPRESPTGVQLKSFFGSEPSRNTQSAASWRTYAPGKMPPGRAVTAVEAGEIAERGQLGEHLYLRGNFLVTASGEGKAVLRAQGAGTQPGSPPARIIVEYPSSAAPPLEGSTVERDENRAFEVRDVHLGADGRFNIWVREITQGD